MFFKNPKRLSGIALGFIFLGAVLAGCASLPPLVVKELKTVDGVVGTWKGQFKNRGGRDFSSPITLTLKTGGKYEYVIYGTLYKGTYRIEDGKVAGQSDASGHVTVWTYSEAGERQALKSTSQRGDFAVSKTK